MTLSPCRPDRRAFLAALPAAASLAAAACARRKYDTAHFLRPEVSPVFLSAAPSYGASKVVVSAEPRHQPAIEDLLPVTALPEGAPPFSRMAGGLVNPQGRRTMKNLVATSRIDWPWQDAIAVAQSGQLRQALFCEKTPERPNHSISGTLGHDRCCYVVVSDRRRDKRLQDRSETPRVM